MTEWVPQTRTRTDIIAPWPVRAMRGLLNQEPAAQAGDPLPLGWHWLYFHDALRSSDLGRDGHAERGHFLPPVSLPRRMWAGGTLVAHRPLVIGRTADLRSTVVRVEEKEGRTGPLVFVTVGHQVHQDGLAVEEEQTLVFRGRGAVQGTSPRGVSGHAGGSEWTKSFTPTTVTLFQFSALTYNAHRIHYDLPYVTGEEGYGGLLVHAPLTALALLAAAVENLGPVARYRYKAMAPLLVDEEVRLVGRGPDPEDARVQLVEAVAGSGNVVMRGWLDLGSPGAGRA